MARANTLKVDIVIIDPQNDFMDLPNSSLPVAGATADMDRVAKLVKRVGGRLHDIHVTLDSHRSIDVAHPAFWVDANNQHPAPFTMISHDDVKNGIWTPRGGARQKMLDYTRRLADNGKYVLMIWPEHCLIGSWGHNVYEPLKKELDEWERKRFATVDYVTKGTNVWTEHYGALMAEVPDGNDPSTLLNGHFLNTLRDADIIALSGEASSHCVKATIEQIADNIGDAHLSKLHILTDCTSPVAQTPGAPDFPQIASDFMQAMAARGLVLTTSDRFLA